MVVKMMKITIAAAMTGLAAAAGKNGINEVNSVPLYFVETTSLKASLKPFASSKGSLKPFPSPLPRFCLCLVFASR
jgi:hypothetical protein